MLFAKRELRVPRPVLGLLALIGLALFSTNALAESGAEIYKARCSACHAASGAGDTMLGKNMKLRALGSPDVQKRVRSGTRGHHQQRQEQNASL